MNWYWAIFGLAKIELADDDSFERLTNRFVEGSLATKKEEGIPPQELLAAFVKSVDSQPELSQRLIDLFEDPRLDVVISRGTDKESAADDHSLRSTSLHHLRDISVNLRERFVPMLRRFAESGTAEESKAATAVLEAWMLP